MSTGWLQSLSNAIQRFVLPLQLFSSIAPGNLPWNSPVWLRGEALTHVLNATGRTPEKISAFAIHPGFIATNLGRHVTAPGGWVDRVARSVTSWFFKTIPQVGLYIRPPPRLAACKGFQCGWGRRECWWGPASFALPWCLQGFAMWVREEGVLAGSNGGKRLQNIQL